MPFTFRSIRSWLWHALRRETVEELRVKGK